VAIVFVKRVLVERWRAFTLLLALGIVLGLFVGGAQPVAVGLFPAPWDKVAHASLFAVLAASIGLASGLRGWRMLALAVAGALVVATLDEWHQVYLPGRSAGLDDLAADAVGSLLGAVLLMVMAGKRRDAVCSPV